MVTKNGKLRCLKPDEINEVSPLCRTLGPSFASNVPLCKGYRRVYSSRKRSERYDTQKVQFYSQSPSFLGSLFLPNTRC